MQTQGFSLFYSFFFLIITSSCHDDFLATSRPVSRLYSREEKFRKFFFPDVFPSVDSQVFSFFFFVGNNELAHRMELSKGHSDCFDLYKVSCYISIDGMAFFFYPFFGGYLLSTNETTLKMLLDPVVVNQSLTRPSHKLTHRYFGLFHFLYVRFSWYWYSLFMEDFWGKLGLKEES